MTEPQREDPFDYLDAMAKKLQDPEAYLRFLELKLDRQESVVPPPESGVRPIVDAPEDGSP